MRMGTAHCPDCAEEFDVSPFRNDCPVCGGLLMAGRPTLTPDDER